MAINRPNNRFFNRASRLQASTPPAIEHLSFASPDSCTESTAEHFRLEQAMIQQQAMLKDALSPHTPSPLPADADAIVTDTDILYLAGLQPQPVEWLCQPRHAATPLDDRVGEDGYFHWTGLSNLTPEGLLAAPPTGAGLPKRKFVAQRPRDCLQPGSQTQGSIKMPPSAMVSASPPYAAPNSISAFIAPKTENQVPGRGRCRLRRMSTRQSTRQDAQINYLSTLSIFMKQTTYLATLPNPHLKANECHCF
jgi:hypothetical protein